jgi:hypothetical protein
MIARHELQDLVQRRLKGIMPISEINGLERGWEELSLTRLDMSREVRLQCFDLLARRSVKPGCRHEVVLQETAVQSGLKEAQPPQEDPSQQKHPPANDIPL